MPQIFPPVTNVISRASLAGFLVILIVLVFAWGAICRSPFMTYATVVKPQPIPFSHRHHVAELGIDCRYCHSSVEQAAFAGMPATSTCMNCHSQIHTSSAMLAPVRESFRSGVPIEWQRVHDLPDFVYFNHSIHVNKGVACETCHGAVDQMPLMWQEATLHMDWCLECHRDPGAFVRPPGHVFDFWHGSPPADALAIDGAAALAAHGVEPVGTELTNCTACHR